MSQDRATAQELALGAHTPAIERFLDMPLDVGGDACAEGAAIGPAVTAVRGAGWADEDSDLLFHGRLGAPLNDAVPAPTPVPQRSSTRQCSALRRLVVCLYGFSGRGTVMRFKNREEAAALLVGRLGAYRAQHPLVLGVPRGGVPMARLIADARRRSRRGLVRKLRAPGRSELAIGAVDETGTILEGRYFDLATDDYLREEVRTQLGILRMRREQYTRAHAAVDPEGRTVIIVDDGVATGSSVLSAIRSVRARNPKKVVLRSLFHRHRHSPRKSVPTKRHSVGCDRIVRGWPGLQPHSSGTSIARR